MSFTVSASTNAPYQARQALEQIDDAGRPDVILATSELVANAVMHGQLDEGDPIRVDVRRLGERIQVSVSHKGPPVEVSRRGSGSGSPAGGYGFEIVGQVAERWDVEHRHGTTRAWFEA